MRNFLSKYWKRILILIASIFIMINVVNKCVAPHVLVDEYGKYGPDIESSVNVNIDTSEIISNAKEASNMSDDMFRLVIVAGACIIAALIITEFMAKKSAGKKK